MYIFFFESFLPYSSLGLGGGGYHTDTHRVNDSGDSDKETGRT